MAGEAKSVLVIGGGMAGITAALEAAETGLAVQLVEREPTLGGRVVRVNQYFPKLCPPTCGLEINFRRLRENPAIKVHTLTEVKAISGGPGAFQVTLVHHPRYVNARCTACGKCAEACDREIPNPHNYGLDKVKAAYLPHEQAYPARFVLDPSLVGTEAAKAVQAACPCGAIDLEMKEETSTLEVAAIVVATGWAPFDASRLEQMGFGRLPDVVNNVMMERLGAKNGPTAGKFLRPSDGREVKRVAFCQCAGSRDENHQPWCSRVCCLASLKQARMVREQYPDAEVWMFYIDLRALGRNETFLAGVQADDKVHLVKGKAARISLDPQTQDLVVEAEDTAAGAIARVNVDLAVLATGMTPAVPAGIEGADEDGFLSRPAAGVIAAGSVRQPLDVSAAVQDATGAALKALQLARGQGS